MSYSIQSLLDFPQTALDSNTKKEEQKTNGQSEQEKISINSVPQMLFDNFWLAFDALDLK